MKIPSLWMPDCRMKAIVAHWTAGGHKASLLDKEHYHILVESDGDLVLGDHSIKDNVNTKDDDYAAHTRGFNTGVIGITACCMLGAVERPFNAGVAPMLEAQWLVLVGVAAQLARRYNIPIDDHHILGHGEVQDKLGIVQRGKWDPMVLPWNQHLNYQQVGELFRAKVKEAQGRL